MRVVERDCDGVGERVVGMEGEDVDEGVVDVVFFSCGADVEEESREEVVV